MILKLDNKVREELKRMRRKERDARRHVRLSVLLALDSGYSIAQVSELFGLDDGTVYRHIRIFEEGGLQNYLDTNWVPYVGRLTEEQLELLKAEVHQTLYTTAKEVGAWITKEFGVEYHVKQVVKILHKLGFVYKKTKLVPGKANKSEQEAYLREFEEMIAEKDANTVVFFNDGVHPQFNTRPEYAWIMQGQEYEMPSQAGRQRLNITGAVNAEAPTEIYALEAEAVNAQSTIALWQRIEDAYPGQEIIHICDNAKYYKCAQIREWLSQHPRTTVKYLPAYSPNLNPIERVWKYLKKETINSYWYENLSEFRRSVMAFFENTSQRKAQLESLVTLNFRPVGY